MADLQATRGGDYLTGHGSMRIAGTPAFQALGRVSVDNLGVYAPAYTDLLPEAYAGAAPIHALTAGVRLEGSTLHLDQCQGEQDGNEFQLGGSVDLRDAGNPLLDLTLTGQWSHAANLSGVSYALDLRGPLAGGATIHGDVQLSGGHPNERWTIYPANPLPPATPDELMQPLFGLLPKAWGDWPLALHVIAADPLPDERADQEAQIMPDIDLTGTGRQPRPGGKLDFRSAAGPEQESGAWYFSPDEPENPVVSVTVTENDGKRGTFFFGPLDEEKSVSWDLAEAGGPLVLQAGERPPQTVEDASPWAGWTQAAPGHPVLFVERPRPTNASFGGL